MKYDKKWTFIILVSFIISTFGAINSQSSDDIRLESKIIQNYQKTSENINGKHIINPFPYVAQNDEYYSSSAALSMISNYYGYNIGQSHYYDIIDMDLTGITGFKGTSYTDFIDAAEYDSFTGRDYGYIARLYCLKDYTQEERYDFLKSVVDQKTPFVHITRRSFSNTTYRPHYRICTGYDERQDVFFMNDPWATADGYGHGGPYTLMKHENMEIIWANTNYRVITVETMSINLDIEENRPINNNSQFILNCHVDTSCFDGVPVNLTVDLTLPEGYTLETGSEIKTINEIDTTAGYECSWTVTSASESFSDDDIKVKVTAPFEGHKVGSQTEIYPIRAQKPILDYPETLSSYNNEIVSKEFPIITNITYSAPEFKIRMNYCVKNTDGYKRLGSTEVGDNIKNIYVNSSEIMNYHSHFDNNYTVFCWLSVKGYDDYYYSPITVFKVDTTLEIEEFTIPVITDDEKSSPAFTLLSIISVVPILFALKKQKSKF